MFGAHLVQVSQRCFRERRLTGDIQPQRVHPQRPGFSFPPHPLDRCNEPSESRPTSTRSVFDRSPIIFRIGTGKLRTSVGIARISSSCARCGCFTRSITSSRYFLPSKCSVQMRFRLASAASDRGVCPAMYSRSLSVSFIVFEPLLLFFRFFPFIGLGPQGQTDATSYCRSSPPGHPHLGYGPSAPGSTALVSAHTGIPLDPFRGPFLRRRIPSSECRSALLARGACARSARVCGRCPAA